MAMSGSFMEELPSDGQLAGGRWSQPYQRSRRPCPRPCVRVVATEKSVLVASVDVTATMDTLLGDDVGACLAPSDPPHMGAFARRASARVAGLAAPTTGAAALPASAVAAREAGPLALGRVLPCLDGMANGTRQRQT